MDYFHITNKSVGSSESALAVISHFGYQKRPLCDVIPCKGRLIMGSSVSPLDLLLFLLPCLFLWQLEVISLDSCAIPCTVS